MGSTYRRPCRETATLPQWMRSSSRRCPPRRRRSIAGRGSSTRRCARSPSTATPGGRGGDRRAGRRLAPGLLRHVRRQGGGADLGLRRRGRLRDPADPAGAARRARVGARRRGGAERPTWRSSTAIAPGRWPACATCRPPGERVRAARDAVRAPILDALRRAAALPAAGGVGVETMLTAIDAIAVDGLRHDPDQPLLARQRELAAFALAPFGDAPVPNDAGGAPSVHAPVERRRRIEALLDGGAGGDAALELVVREAASLRDGPTLWRVVAGVQRRRARRRAGGTARSSGSRWRRSGEAWFFGLALEDEDDETPRSSCALPALRRGPSGQRRRRGAARAGGRPSLAGATARCGVWRPRGYVRREPQARAAPTAGGPPRRRRADRGADADVSRSPIRTSTKNTSSLKLDFGHRRLRCRSHRGCRSGSGAGVGGGGRREASPWVERSLLEETTCPLCLLAGHRWPLP